jgi:hypothetical protein
MEKLHVLEFRDSAARREIAENAKLRGIAENPRKYNFLFEKA